MLTRYVRAKIASMQRYSELTREINKLGLMYTVYSKIIHRNKAKCCLYRMLMIVSDNYSC